MTSRKIVHIEIPSGNLEQSSKFYNELFGWKITPFPEMNYATWEPEEGPGGGFSPLGEETKVGEILIHVASDDIEADLKRAEALGGSILRQKSEIPNIGWWGIFKDPQGNAIALYTRMNPQASG
jgi:hypothetical protein